MDEQETLFFVHVMKTAGTSFLFYIREALTPARIFPADDDPLTARFMLDELRAISPERRRGLRAYTGHFPAFAAELVGASRTATVLRDPVERTISMLKQRQRLHTPEMTLDQIYEDPSVFGPFIDNHQTKVFSMDPSDDPESYMDVIAIDQSRLDAAKERLAAIDVVGVQDDFPGLLRTAQDAFGWPAPRGNFQAFRSEEVPVPDGLRERIAADHPWDRELYGFARQLATERRSTRP
jgi:hypothetical protein